MYINLLNHRSFLKAAAAVAITAVPFSASVYAANNDDESSSRSFLFFKKKNKHTAQPDTTSSSTKEKYDDFHSGDAVVSDGIFKVIKKGADYYFEIPRSVLGRDMLVVNKFTRVPLELNSAGVNRGINYANQMIRFELDSATSMVRARQQRPMPDVKNGNAIATSVADNYISPFIAAFKIEAYSPDSTAVVIKVNDIFNGKNTSFNNVFSDINIGGSAISDLSRIKSIKAFSNNVYAVSELTTKVVEPTGTVFVTVEVGSTILLLPENPMARRLESPRIGYFSESLLNYSDAQQRVPTLNYITRWRLEPKKGEEKDYLAGKLVEPEKPIVFWIDKSTPYQWRKYIRKGIEDWNSAFEVAGFKNAIRVEQESDSTDIDTDDINFSTLTYAASTKTNAMGPSVTDPRTGEILEADIIWWHNVLDLLRDWIVIQTGATDPRARTPQLPDDLLGDAMRFVACHEVGHSLGLRHNMIASASVPTDSLRSPSFIKEFGGTSASIMDYARFNYIAQPGDGVESLSPQIGPYDRLAIEYGYRWYPDHDPNKEYVYLQELIDNHDSPWYRYSEAQSNREATDPRAMSEDLGDDPVKSAKYGIANLKRIMPHIIEWTVTGEPGQDYDDVSRLYWAAIGQWQRYIYHVMANIGGVNIDNVTMGDGRHAYTFVDADRQRQSTKYIIDEVFTYPEWLFNNDISNYTFLVRNTPVGRIEDSPTYTLTNIQCYIFWDLLSDDRIIRMYENEAANGNSAFKASDMMDMLHSAIFEKVARPDVRQRSVQKNFVDALTIAACESRGVKDDVKRSLTDADMPMNAMMPLCRHAAGEHSSASRTINFYGKQENRISDAISLKRGELMRIRTLLKSRISSAPRDVKNHYQDLVMRIDTALGLDHLR